MRPAQGLTIETVEIQTVSAVVGTVDAQGRCRAHIIERVLVQHNTTELVAIPLRIQ